MVGQRARCHRPRPTGRQLLESSDEKKQAGGIGWSSRARSASHQCRDCPRSISVQIPGRSNSSHCSWSSILVASWNLRETRTEAQNAEHQGLQGPDSVLSRIVGPSLHRLEHQSQWHTLVRSIMLYAAAAHAWQPRDVETLEMWQNRALRHIARAPCPGSARMTFEGGLECARSCLRCKSGGCCGPRHGFVREHSQKTNVQVLVKL